MTLEQFLPEGEKWDITIHDGPGPFAIGRYVSNLLATGYRGPRDESIMFTVKIDGIIRRAVMLSPAFSGAYAETDTRKDMPVLRVDGELLFQKGVIPTHIPVSGLFSIREHSGGLMVTGEPRTWDYGYHFK